MWQQQYGEANGSNLRTDCSPHVQHIGSLRDVRLPRYICLKIAQLSNSTPTHTCILTPHTHTQYTPLCVCVCNLNFCVVNGAGRRSRFATSFCVYYCVLDSSLSLSFSSHSLPSTLPSSLSLSATIYKHIKYQIFTNQTKTPTPAQQQKLPYGNEVQEEGCVFRGGGR